MARPKKSLQLASDNRNAKKMFISLLEKYHTVRVAIKFSGLSPDTVYNWKRNDPVFAKDWEEAIATSNEILESATYLKALYGTTPAAITASIFLLKGMFPEKYAERLEVKQSVYFDKIDWDTLPLEVKKDYIADKLTEEDVYNIQLQIKAQSYAEHTGARDTGNNNE